MKKAGLLVLLVAAAFLVSACIGIESTVTFDKSGSGVAKFEYRMSKMLTEASEGGQAEVPLPVSEEAFELAVEGHSGLKIVGITSSETETDVLIGAEIAFDSIEAFTEVEDFNDMPMSLEKDGGDFVFKQVISEGMSESDEAGAAEMEAMIKEIFQGQEYELAFVVNAPSRIKKRNFGELSSDGKTVRFAMPFFDFIGLKEETVLTVVW